MYTKYVHLYIMNMKSLKNYIVILLTVLCVSCHTKENKRLTNQLDSVNKELTETKQALLDARQVGMLLDSIDASRRVINHSIIIDTESKNNLTRLSDINAYVKDINLKMDQMEKSIKYVNYMSNSILKLQADVKARTYKLSKLEVEAHKMDSNNKVFIRTMQQKDSTLAVFVATCHQDVATLQKVMEEVHVKNNIATANLYFKQAESLAGMANDLKPAARRKFVQQEALEMYKISLSLGKKEAEQRIASLQTQL